MVVSLTPTERMQLCPATVVLTVVMEYFYLRLFIIVIVGVDDDPKHLKLKSFVNK